MAGEVSEGAQPRVVITGIGILSPVGLDTASSWSALLAGTSGVAPIAGFDRSASTSRSPAS